MAGKGSGKTHSPANVDKAIVKLVIIIAVIAIFMGINLPGIFFSRTSFSSMAFQVPEFGLFALAMSMAMFTGGSDLSIVSTANMTAIITGMFFQRFYSDGMGNGTQGMLIAAGLLLSVLIGIGAGLINSLLIAVISVPPILATLGTMSFYGGIGIAITKGSALYGMPPMLQHMGNGYMLGFIPIPAFIYICALIVIFIVMQRSDFGVKLYMLGTNRKAYVFSGMNSRRMLTVSYCISGVLSALAGFIILARTNTANADYGSTYIMQSILVGVLGGVDPKGGSGKVTGILLATVTIQMLSSGLNMMNVNAYFKQFVYGTLLIVMIISNTWSVLAGRPKRRKTT